MDENDQKVSTVLASTVLGKALAEYVSKDLLNSEKIYVNGQRIHHYQIGLGGMLTGGLMFKSDDKRIRDAGLITFGTGLGIFLDDFDDFLKDLSKLFGTSRGE